MQAVPSHCGVSQSNVMEGCLPTALPGPDRAPHAEGTRGTQRPALPLTTSSTDPQLAAPPSPERPPVAFVELRRPPWPLFPPADVLYRDRVRKTLLPAPGSSQKETESGQGLLELSLGTVPHVGAPAVHGSDSRWWHQLEAMELAVVARRQADEKREANEERRVRERKQAEERKEAEAKRQLGISSALLPLRAQVHAFPEERTTGGDDETASSSVPSLGTTGSAIPHTQDPCEGMMGEGQGEASASADSQGAAGGFADAQTPSRGEGESVWMSGRLGGVDEGSGSGRPPAHQLPHALSVYSGRDMVGVDDQTTSPGDEDMSPLSSGAVDDAVIQEVLLWLEGATGEDDGAAQTSDDTHTAVTNLSMLPTHSFGAGEEEGASTTMSRESQRRSSDFSSETPFHINVAASEVSSETGADTETQGMGTRESMMAISSLRPSAELLSEEGFVTPSPAPQRVQETGLHQSSGSGIQGTGSVQATMQFPAIKDDSVRFSPTWDSEPVMEWWPLQLVLELQTPTTELASETPGSSVSFPHFGSVDRETRAVDQPHGSADERDRSRLTGGSAGHEEASSKGASDSKGSLSFSGVSARTSGKSMTLGDAMPSFRDVETVDAVSGSDGRGSVPPHPEYLGLQERGAFHQHRRGRLHAATFGPLTRPPQRPQSHRPLRERAGVSGGTLSPSAFTADSPKPSGNSSSEKFD
ncbi:hypothetical protein TGME49_329800 [Toxoplasma gondii ME49]|uniref:Uncharacterized protein n=1 Tax=Toxoplasma gondii (strain ATCC 50611 / Me49) TaxID=508771 RepID=S8EU35_TOXGM|nr:hypothetical protein TGME49_329800 [Toxoplasma gondii ME49]EPT24483.1 hypothetical protein TGME49_329800 [Toxoplasma gondii ME49]|eukprot:XP_018634722.1 hypothetical protein TGME49_329800 [Toxoplasma gondii ME49]